MGYFCPDKPDIDDMASLACKGGPISIRNILYHGYPKKYRYSTAVLVASVELLKSNVNVLRQSVHVFDVGCMICSKPVLWICVE